MSEKSFYRLIGMPEPVSQIHSLDASQKIIQHYVHSYDEHGNVIVVEGDKEDLSKSIPQFQSEVGAKNIIRLIESGGDPMTLLNGNKSRAFDGNFTNMDFASVNELGSVLPGVESKASKALSDFNKKFNTSLDMNTFIKLYNNGLLGEHVQGLNKEKEVVKDESK